MGAFLLSADRRLEVSGPRIVKVGSPAEFQVQVTFKGSPIRQRIGVRRYMLFDSRGELVELANPEPAGDGCGGSAQLETDGASLLRLHRLELAVTSRLLRCPPSRHFRFVTYGKR